MTNQNEQESLEKSYGYAFPTNLGPIQVDEDNEKAVFIKKLHGNWNGFFLIEQVISGNRCNCITNDFPIDFLVQK